MRTTFTQRGNRVTLQHEGALGDTTIREFSVAPEGGGVREWCGRDYHFVCEGLGRTGAMLMATPETLITVVSREWQAGRGYFKTD